MHPAAKVRYWLLLEEAALAEMRAEATRLDRPLSRIVRLAWRLSTDERRLLDSRAAAAMRIAALRSPDRPTWVHEWLERRGVAQPRDGLTAQMIIFDGEDFAELCALVQRSRAYPDEIVTWAWQTAKERVAATLDATQLDTAETSDTQEVVDGRAILKTPLD